MEANRLEEAKVVDIALASPESKLELPLAEAGISAGFPSPALDFSDATIDLNKHLIKNAPSTYIGRVNGESLKNIGIMNNSLLIIDRSRTPKNDDIAVCFIDGDFTLKRIHKEKNELWLLPENESFPPIQVKEGNQLIIWGIVTHCINSY